LNPVDAQINEERKMKGIMTAAAFAGMAMLAGAALAHGEAKQGKKEARALSADEHAFGREGDPKKASRTVRIDMSDKMRFSPDRLSIRQGETVKFIVRNSGKTMHELVIGSMKELKAHAELMRKHPDMEHEEPYMAHVSPGKSETLVWHFTKAGEFHFGCLIPGHFESGMVGMIVVKP
jgi:uncharacterized cupredoxin-like copper-binding protein